MRIAIEQPLQHGRVFIVDDRHEGRAIVGCGCREVRCLGGFDKMENSIDVAGNFRRRRPEATDVAPDPLQLIDQCISLGVARVHHQDPGAPQILHQAANARLHGASVPSLIQRLPRGVTAR